jgi:hypothetical protein
MTPRFARLSLAAFLSAVVPFAHAQPPAPGAPTATPAIAPAGSPDEPVALKLPNADIDTVISLLEQYTGKIALRPATLPTAT